MPTPRRNALLVVALLAVLAVPLNAATGSAGGGSAPAPARTASSGAGSRLLSWLGEIWPDLGCTMDPSGHCLPGNPPPQAAPVGH
jgi:hypothetical protein